MLSRGARELKSGRESARHRFVHRIYGRGLLEAGILEEAMAAVEQGFGLLLQEPTIFLSLVGERKTVARKHLR